jgi:epoxyqueuosine reductase
MAADPPAELRSWIKGEARRLGFDLAGVTSPEPPTHLDVYEGWLAAGRHGEMAYLASETARQRRADPRQVMPECRSILVLAARYPAPLPYTRIPVDRPGVPLGRIAAYAWGADYHDTLLERMRRLVESLQAHLGQPVPHRAYTDTGPLLERELAQRAGLGWIGKNTCLIHPRLGSYFLLAEILLGIPLPAGAPFRADRCGSCTRCIQACPAQCILPDRTLDARRCLSYLTIELKGSIPHDLRPQMGEWVFGCDICQQVCPWNRFASPQGDPAFAPRPGLPQPDLLQELTLTAEQFNRKFKASPLRRAKRRGYLRNVAIALGNGAQAVSIPALGHALRHDPEPLVRAHAAWALGQMGSTQAIALLRQATHTETDRTVLDEIQAAL